MLNRGGTVNNEGARPKLFSAKPADGDRKPCDICNKPNHITEHCFKNPNNPRNRLTKSNDKFNRVDRSFNARRVGTSIVDPTIVSLPLSDFDVIETRIVERVQSDVKVGSQSGCSILVPKDNSVLVDFGGGPTSCIIDSGSQITVCHPDCIPPHILSSALEHGEVGQVVLRGAFGDEIKSQTFLISCKMVSRNNTLYDTPSVLIYCAVSNRLCEDKVLLSLQDFQSLQQASTGYVPYQLVNKEHVKLKPNQLRGSNINLGSAPNIKDYDCVIDVGGEQSNHIDVSKVTTRSQTNTIVGDDGL